MSVVPPKVPEEPHKDCFELFYSRLHYHSPYTLSDSGVNSIDWQLVINIHDF